VTIHEQPINAYGWTGYGYSIIDPETGEGGYVIEGSGNGSLYILVGAVFLILALITVLQFGATLLLSYNIILSELAMGFGFILMGIGLIYDQPWTYDLGVAVAMAGILHFSKTFALVRMVFATNAEGVSAASDILQFVYRFFYGY
jgi:amino acid transporter